MDDDGDGLSNADESIRMTLKQEADTDGDGMTDNEEVLARTDPTDAADVFRVESVIETAPLGLSGPRELAITIPIKAGITYRLLRSNPPEIFMGFFEHAEDALRNWHWADTGLSHSAAADGTHTFTVTSLPEDPNFEHGLINDGIFYTVEVRGNANEYIGVFTRPVGRFVQTLYQDDADPLDVHSLNYLSAPLHAGDVYEARITGKTATEVSFTFPLGTSPFTNAGPFDLASANLPGHFWQYVAIVTRDQSLDPMSDTRKISDRGLEGDWWPVTGLATTVTTDDTLVLDMSYSGVSPLDIPIGSSVALRRTSSLEDLFEDPKLGSLIAVNEDVLIRRPRTGNPPMNPGGDDLIATFNNTGDWDVSLNSRFTRHFERLGHSAASRRGGAVQSCGPCRQQLQL